MTNQVTGTVVALTERTIMSKAGKKYPKHGVTLDSGQFFELDGFKQRYSVGDRVESIPVAYNYKIWTEIPKTSGVGLPPAPATMAGVSSATAPAALRPAAAGGAGSWSKDVGFPIPQDSYQMAIIRQNALTNATALVNHLPTPAVIGKEALQDEAFARAEMAVKIAYKLTSFSSGHLDAMVAESVAKEIKGLRAATGAKVAE